MEHVGELLAAARAQCGLDDFGDDSFREGLEILVGSLQREAHLSPVGEIALPAIITGLLVQRLQIEDWYRRHPDIDEEPIVAPLIGLSLPRTGSTALSCLLAEDPDARSLRTYEATEPCPPPSTVLGPDPRIARAEASDRMQQEMTPRAKALVPTTPTGPQECQMLMGLDFKTHIFQAFAYIPSYSDWLLNDADLVSTYAYERRTLKLLQWGEPDRPWILKCPSHLLFIDQLDQVFPDARYVMTHRDPTEVMVSVADLYEVMYSQFSVHVDLAYLGSLNVEHWSVGMERTLAFRDRGNDKRFYDIGFKAMQRDPIGEVRGLYAWLDQPVTPAFADGMERWWHDWAQGREENVHPDPSRFGLDLEEIRPLFASYNSRIDGWVSHQEETKKRRTA
jgi:hypothetical protein